MNNPTNKSTSEDFKLLSYLAADLRRAHMLMHGKIDGVSSWRLWLGALSPRFLPVLLCRIAHCLYLLKFGPVAKLVSLFNFFLFGIEIAICCPIGKGLFLPHTQGTVIGARGIGKNATIFQQVTLGARELDMGFNSMLRPEIGDNVTLGSGAKILGGVTVGDRVTVGANSVVITDIPHDVLCAGAPAKVVRRKEGFEG